MFTRSFQTLPVWKFKKSHTKVNLKLARTSLSVQLQHDAGKFWGIVIFTGSCKMLPFEHDLVQRSALHSSEILMWRICVKLQHDTCNYWGLIVFTRQPDRGGQVSKFKKSHKGEYQTCQRIWCREHPYKVTTWYKQSMKSYRVQKVLDAAHLPSQRQNPSSLSGWGVKTTKPQHSWWFDEIFF